jgi:hypothetical protein
MKITKTQLKQIIKEELGHSIEELSVPKPQFVKDMDRDALQKCIQKASGHPAAQCDDPEMLKQAEMIVQQKVQEQEQQPAQPTDARQKKVASATTSGAMLGAEEYVNMLKQVLLTPKVAPQARKQALEALFGQKGAAINSLVLQMLKGAQE